MLNVKPNNLLFLKIYNTVIDDITVTFTDKNGKILVIEDKVNLTLLVY